MPTNSRGPNNSGSRPSGKGSPVGGSFLSLPKDTVKPPPPRPAPSIITQPPANKLRQPPPKIVEPPPPPPPPAISAAAGGGAAGGLNVGAVASALAIAIALVLFFDEPLSKDQANVKLQPPEPPKDVEPPDYPFYGGQMPGVLYDVTYELGGSNVPKYVDTKRYYGSIVSTRFQQFDGGNTVYYIRTGGFYFFGYKPPSTKDQITNLFGMQNPFIRITSIRRVEAAPDTGGNPPPQNQPSVSSPGNSLGAPSAAPPSAAPSPAPRAPGISGSPGTGPSGAPGGFPGSLPGGSPGSSPSGFPRGFPSPAPAPKKGPAPQPNKYPGPAPSPSPSPSPNGDPGPAPGPGVGGPAPAPTPNGVPKIGPAPYVSPHLSIRLNTLIPDSSPIFSSQTL